MLPMHDMSEMLHLSGVSADEKLMPLLGKRILITAPRQYATKLASCLITSGARPVWLPSISITRINDQSLGAVSQALLLFSIKSTVYVHKVVAPVAAAQQHGGLLPLQRLVHGPQMSVT